MNESAKVYISNNMNNKNEKKTDFENNRINSNEKNAKKPVKKNLIKGLYVLGEVIGEGNFGVVRLANQIKIGEKLAIKIINKNKITKESDIIRIKKEISILKKIRHKNIIQIYEVMESNQNIYIAMEICEGKELFDYIIKNKKLKEIEACRIFRQLINGIDYIHSQGIIHRDLKPENILLDENMDIKITDFGLSTFFIKGEYLSTPCGTPNYSPPEMLKGKEYDGEMSDIWSCGIVLYSMLTGCLPCAESKETVILNKIMSNQYIIPNYLSHDAIDLLNLMLQLDFKKRIKIKDIMKHPWFNICKNKLTPGIDIKNNEYIPIDENILKKMRKYGYNIEECRDNLQRMKNNSLTTVYHLLLKKFIQNKGQSIADLKSPVFLEYMKKNNCSESKNLFNQNVFNNIAENNSKIKNYKNIFINSGLNDSCINNYTLKKNKNFEIKTKFQNHSKKKSQEISNLSLQLQQLNFNKEISFSKSNNKNINNSNILNPINYDKIHYLTRNKYLYSNNFIRISKNNNMNTSLNENKDKKSVYKTKKYSDIKKTKNIETKNILNKKINKKFGIISKFSINNVKKLNSLNNSKEIKKNISNNNLNNNPAFNNKKCLNNFSSLTESMTYTNNAMNLLSSSITIYNTSKDKNKISNKKKNKLKSISPKKKLILTQELICKVKNENLKNGRKLNKNQEIKNNINIIKIISNKIKNYKINNSFEETDNIKNKNNYESIIQKEDLKKETYLSVQMEQDNNNVRKNITTERLFTESKKKKNYNENIIIDKSDSPMNNFNGKKIYSFRADKNNTKTKNGKNNFNNKLIDKKYSNRHKSTKNVEYINIRKTGKKSESPKNNDNNELMNNFKINNTNDSLIFETEKGEVESKDSKRVKIFSNTNKLFIKISNSNIRAKADIKLKKEYGNKKLNKGNINNDNSNNNIINDSIKEIKIINNEKNIYKNKFLKRNISPIEKFKGILKSQTIEKNIFAKKSLRSKDILKENEKNIEINKKYEAHTNKIIKIKNNKLSNFNNINNNINNNKNKDILNYRQNTYIEKIFNTNSNAKKNDSININNGSALNKKKHITKICHTRTGSDSDRVSFFSKIKIISNKSNYKSRQREQFLDENGLHIKHLTSGNILTEYTNKTYNKSFNINLKKSNADLDIIAKNYTILELIEKISNFLKKEKYNITKKVNPNFYLLECYKERRVFHIEIIPLTSKNNNIFYLKSNLIKGDFNIFNNLIINLQKIF